MTTFKKLRNGSWGVLGVGPVPEPGALLTVAKRSGEEQQVTIARVLWTGPSRESEDSWIATIKREPRARRVRTFDEFDALCDAYARESYSSAFDQNN